MTRQIVAASSVVSDFFLASSTSSLIMFLIKSSVCTEYLTFLVVVIHIGTITVSKYSNIPHDWGINLPLKSPLQPLELLKVVVSLQFFYAPLFSRNSIYFLVCFTPPSLPLDCLWTPRLRQTIFLQVFAVLPNRPVASLSLGAQYAMAQRSRRQIYETAFDSKVRWSFAQWYCRYLLVCFLCYNNTHNSDIYLCKVPYQ